MAEIGRRMHEAFYGDLLDGVARMRPFASSRIIIETAERIEIGADVGLGAVDLFGGEGVDAAEHGGTRGRRLEVVEGKLEQFPAGGGAEKIVGVEVGVDPLGVMEGADGG